MSAWIWQIHKMFSHPPPLNVPHGNSPFYDELCLSARQVLIEQRQMHLTVARLEREDYYLNKLLCSKRSENMSIIVDGMDQEKLTVPCLTRYPKGMDKSACLRLGMMGVKLVSGRVYKHLYLNSNRFQRNANGTMNAAIASIAHLFRQREKEGQPRPTTAFFQLDNCPTENKSKAIYGLFAALVGLGVFDEVLVNFLIVGHTHEDIDQMFSVISKWLADRQAWTPADMLALLRQCSLGDNKAARVTVQTQQVDYVSWIRLVLGDMAGVQTPHALKFTRDSDGGVALFSKVLSTDASWQSHGVLLSRLQLKTLVATSPTYVPLAPLDTNKLRSLMAKCDREGILPAGALKVWEQFLQQEEHASDSACSECL
jgi:hypothetical protein